MRGGIKPGLLLHSIAAAEGEEIYHYLKDSNHEKYYHTVRHCSDNSLVYMP